MATEKEWQDYFERLLLRIRIIQNSNLSEIQKEEEINELLDKISIVKKFFLGDTETDDKNN